MLLRALPGQLPHSQRARPAAHGNNAHDPARRAKYIDWRQQRLFELWRLWDSEIRKLNPAARYIPNSGGGATADLDMKTIGELAPILFADRQARSGVTPPWANGKNGKEYRSTMGTKPIGGIFSVGVEEPYRWKDSVQSAPEIRLWVLDGIANGLRPWFTKFAGSLNDRRWLPVVEQLYTWHYKNERYLRNERPLARVALVYSQQTNRFFGRTEDHTLGYYQALVEARIPFEMVHDQLLDAAHIDPFQVLVFPNIAALSTRQCAQIRDFVNRGGSIVATHQTSLYDESPGARAAPISDSPIYSVRPSPARSMRACRIPTCAWRINTRCSPDWKTPAASSTESPASTPLGPIPIRP